MLKLRVSQLDEVEEAYRSQYVEDGDGFRLDVEGYKDPAPLLRAKQHERDAHNATKEALREAQEELETAREELESLRARKGGKKDDEALAALEQSYKDKIVKLETKFAAREKELMAHLERTHRTEVAAKLASELSDSPELLQRFIEERLAFELGASGPETRVLDSDGNPSALTLDELRDEFKQDKKYAAIIRGSAASGGGASNTGKHASGALNVDAFAAMKEPERVKLFRENPTEFRRLTAELKARSATA